MNKVLDFDAFVKLCEMYQDVFYDLKSLKGKYSKLCASHLTSSFILHPEFAVWLLHSAGTMYKTPMTFASKVLKLNKLLNPRRSSAWREIYADYERFFLLLKEVRDYAISTQEEKKKSETFPKI